MAREAWRASRSDACGVKQSESENRFKPGGMIIRGIIAHIMAFNLVNRADEP